MLKPQSPPIFVEWTSAWGQMRNLLLLLKKDLLGLHINFLIRTENKYPNPHIYKKKGARYALQA